MSFDRACLLIALMPIALRALLMPIPPHDFWWHLAMGRHIFQTGDIPRLDFFSWTRPGTPFYDQSWLSQCWLYALHQIGGANLIVMAGAIAITLSYALLAQTALQRGASSRAVALALGAVIIISFDNWLVRPQSWAIPIFAVFFAVLQAHRNPHRSGRIKVLWMLPILMALWVNTHGSFVLGAALLILTLLGRSLTSRQFDRELAAWSVPTLGAILLNPRGLEVLNYVRMMLLDPSNKFSAEWLSPTPRNFSDALFFVFALGFFVLLIFARHRPDPTDILIVCAFFWLAITSGRYIIWFAFVALPPLAVALTERLPVRQQHPTRIQRGLNAVLVVLAWLMIVPCLPMWKPMLGLPPQIGLVLSEETPIRAVQFLRQMPPQQRPKRLWHGPPSGSYVAWAAPEQRVWIDTRFEFYPPQQWRDYLALASGEKLSLLRSKYFVDGLLLDRRTERGLLLKVLSSGQWHEVYRDRNFLLLGLHKALRK